MSSSVIAVVAVFNRKEYTRQCLKQFSEQTCPLKIIIVVDDGSTDGTSEMIQEEFPSVRLIQGDGTLYWCRSMHLGLKEALKLSSSQDYILVVNNDLVFEEFFAERMLGTAIRHPKSLIHAANCFLNENQCLCFGGVRMNWLTAKGTKLNQGRHLNEFPKGHVEPSDVLWGRGLLVPVAAIQQFGNFDWRYKQYGDPEFTRRMAKAGYKLLVAYDVVAYMYPETEPNINVRKTYALEEWKQYFFGTLSGANIKTIYLNSMLWTRNRGHGLYFFGCYFMRMAYHFFANVRSFRKHHPEVD